MGVDKLILVTGATGYIASRLIPRLLDHGYKVRCLVRDPARLKGRAWFRYVDVVQGDVMNPSTLENALQGVHTAYYLIHNMSYGHGYIERELHSSRLFASAAEEAALEHIIYLGGLADPRGQIAPHMRSRIETGRVLREGTVPVTEFRAGVILGSGSISFEMIRFMTELFPIVPGPTWMKNKAQPIAIQNVIDYLFAGLENDSGRGQVFEIGGPDIKTYGDLMLGYARIRGLKRRTMLIPGMPLWFMAFGVALMTPVPYPIAYALIHGLSADSIVRNPEELEIFPDVKLLGFDTATNDALKKTHPSFIERVWAGGERSTKSIKHEGCFIHDRKVQMSATPEKVFCAIERLANRKKWIVEVNTDTKLIVRVNHQIAGKQWMEWRVLQADSLACTTLTQTVYFSPNGMPGFLYWFILYPFHVLGSQILIRKIMSPSES